MPAKCVTVKAPAKINVCLEIINRLPDGYHSIRSVLVKLDKLFDTIDLRIGTDGGGITVSSDHRDLPTDERNICHQAARSYLETTGERIGVHLHIRKVIPIAAGLGGGSSDAAAVLSALNHHFDHRLGQSRLTALASNIGKDVPFFLADSATAYVHGTGDKVRALTRLPTTHFLIVNPGVPVSTAEAYRSFSQRAWFMAHPDRADVSRRMVRAIASGDIAKIAGALYNDFEILAERVHPIIKELKQALIAFGAIGALMSGSGPTVFALFYTNKALLKADAALRARYPDFSIRMA